MDMQVIFDNGGGITLVTEDYCHNYDDGAHAGGDVKLLLDGGNTSDWDGNEPAMRIEVEQDDVRNGGYRVYDADDIRKVIETGTIESSWGNVKDFFAALGVK